LGPGKDERRVRIRFDVLPLRWYGGWVFPSSLLGGKALSGDFFRVIEEEAKRLLFVVFRRRHRRKSGCPAVCRSISYVAQIRR
jgi:hypothetical protein